MTDVFEQHGIEHLSHSSIDCFRNEPGLWLMRYLLKHREGTNAAMSRGHAAELGIYTAIMTDSNGHDEAESEFLKLTALGVEGVSREKERANLAAYVDNGVAALKEAGLSEVTDYQEKISIDLEGVKVPIIGFTDITFEGSVVDVKSTGRLPSAISPAHRRQGSIYQKAKGNHAIQFLYTTPKKYGFYTLEDSEQDLNEVHNTALCIQRFLGISKDPMELVQFIAPNFDHFYWNNPSTRAKAKEIWGY